MPIIDDTYLAGFLRQLLETPSPTGYTDAVTRLCCQELERLGVDYEITRRGAIRAKLQGGRRQPARALIAHVDTLGAQIKALKDNGRMELVPIGHWSSRFAEGARCTVFTAEHGAFRGSILPLKASGHTFNDEVDTQPVAWTQVELRPDVVAENRADLEALGFNIGDFIAIDPQAEFLDNGFIVSRHLDDKAGVAAMFAALKALVEGEQHLAVDTYFLISVTEEVGHGASSVLTKDIASMITIDNGTTAPGQNSREFGVTVSMADQTGPFDYHLTQKLLRLCRDEGIDHQRDIFRYYRSDSAAAIEAGADVRTALVTFGIDASHGYERIHMHALHSVARLIHAYAVSRVEIRRDADLLTGDLEGFPGVPMDPAEEEAWDGRDDRPGRPSEG
ncbi:MAG: osmoprotectant NAGGN system M42 family peptidase [Oceanicaulis sp.]|uniref:osmoprotectant NAGGN system M42 family peptidase n=1 Tax=Glycocaulis sp. TaxID=1969725 RepID=UPI0025BDBC6C|nr:osmoprotectant NAGGN system M42 family peptidase [Glycocaulis sp.]MCC5982341.1 osmoprotectant NAGGN system M42 family peptidase [Oceanicaulis sp.]MCH8521802.1 osmoprotectant NAGGN system M42 family peptidase [Glycocaulis sp.]